MTRQKPEALSISLVETVTRSGRGGLDVKHFTEYFIFNQSPGQFVNANLIVTWKNVAKPFHCEVRLVSPSRDLIFCVEDEVQASRRPRWGFAVNAVPVFFSVKESGTHYLEIRVNGSKVKRVPIPAFATGRYYRPRSTLEPEVGTIIIAEQCAMNSSPRSFSARNILTPAGLPKTRKLSYLMTWFNVLKPFSLEVELLSPQGDIVLRNHHEIRSTSRSTCTFIADLDLHDRYFESGVNRMVLKWHDQVLEHPILVQG